MPHKANQNLKDYLNFYLTLDFNGAPFAVWIKGSWGSGKTHFINEYAGINIKEIENGIDAESPVNTEDFCYISLHGIEKKEDIDDKVYRELAPFIFNDVTELTESIILDLVKINSDIDLSKKGLVKKLKKALTNIKDKVLIFDDIERCRIDTTIVLGYIDKFLKHGSKVILIGNEKQLKDQDAFNKIKEKTIGQTFEIEAPYNEVLPKLITQYSGEANSLLEKNLHIITNCFENVLTCKHADGQQNFRAVINVIRDFKFLHKQLKSKFKKEEHSDLEPLLKDILSVYFPLAYEVQLGNISEELKSNNNFNIKDKNITDNIETHKQVLKRHNLLHLFQNNSFIPKQMGLYDANIWHLLLIKNDYEAGINRLYELIMCCPPFYSQEPTYLDHLANFRDLEDDIFIESMTVLNEELSAYKIRNIVKVLEINNLLVQILREEVLISPFDKIANDSDLKSYFEDYLDGLSNKGILDDNNEEIQQLSYSLRHDPLITKYKELFKTQKYDQLIGKENLAQLLEKQDFELYDKMITTEFQFELLFDKEDPQEFFNALLSLKNNKIYSALNPIYPRYNTLYNNKELIEEYDFFKKLLSLATEQLNKITDKSLLKVKLKRIINMCSLVIEELKAYKFPTTESNTSDEK